MNTLEVFLQTILAFMAIFFYTRILGKQQVGQLTFFEYINGITLGSIAAVLATDLGTNSTWYHFLGLTLFAALTWLFGFIAMKSRPARKLIAGEPTIVIHNGKILEQNMGKMRYNLDELTMQLREKNIFNIEDVEFAIMEPNGSLSFLPKSQKRPLTPSDLNMPTGYEGVATELVVDGDILYDNLKQVHLDGNWLRQELGMRGITDLKKVKLASLSTEGKLYLDLEQDALKSPTDITDAS